MTSDYAEWLVFTDWRYRLIYTVDYVAHKIFGDRDFPWLCNLERNMYEHRSDKPWPGYCQNCSAVLTPPDRTDCPSCGADDTDNLA